MSKFLIVCALLCLTSVVLAATSEKSPAQLTKASAHIRALVVKIKRERVVGIKSWNKRKTQCMSGSKIHQSSVKALMHSNSQRRHSIKGNHAANKKRESHIDGLSKKITALKKVGAKQASEIAAADKKRVIARAKFVHHVNVMKGHVAFIRKLFTFIMGSTVERHRTIKLVQKANEVTAHAETMKGKAATLMELTATAMVNGHLDSIYRLLDQLRAKIQSGLRQAQRANLNAEREWVRRSGRRRRAQIRTWKSINKSEENVADLEVAIARAEDHVAHSHVRVERNQLKLQHHKRDGAILMMKCKRWSASYKNNVKSWAEELKALRAVSQKLAGHKW